MRPRDRGTLWPPASHALAKDARNNAVVVAAPRLPAAPNSDFIASEPDDRGTP
jgi:hypothetical protein